MKTSPNKPIYVNMNNSASNDELFVVFLTPPGAEHRGNFQASTGIALAEGLGLRLWDCDGDGFGNHDDLIIDGIAHYYWASQRWGAITRWVDIKPVSDVRDDPDHWANHVDWDALHHPPAA